MTGQLRRKLTTIERKLPPDEAEPLVLRIVDFGSSSLPPPREETWGSRRAIVTTVAYEDAIKEMHDE